MPQHLNFSDEEVPAAGPTPTPAAIQFARCCSSARVDYDFNDPCYVFKVVSNHDGSRLAATLSNNTIKTYSVHAEALSHAGDVLAHTGTITDASFPLSDAPHALYSSSADSSVRGWDLRSGQQAERCVCCSTRGAVPLPTLPQSFLSVALCSAYVHALQRAQTGLIPRAPFIITH